jgi:predicted nucleic acid-binding protein
VIVVDAPVLVAALVDDGHDGRWAESIIRAEPLVAPHLVYAEATNVLRRAAAAGHVSDDIASLAHADLVALTITAFEYEPFADRVWSLRHTVSAHDAWYVAIAERLAAPLATLDGRLASAPGPRCRFRLPTDR